MAPVHVIVVGCGRVGRELAMALDRDGHTVSVIDKDRNAFHHLPDGFGGRPAYLLPSTSGANASSRPADLVGHLRAAAALAG